MKTIKSQMDPHFMFNVLNGLANNVAAGKSNEAHNQILRFSQLLRSMMKRTDKIDISLVEELEFVKNYLELEKFRFKNDFEFTINIEKEVDKNIRLPKMLVQLLVENSIKHGLWDIAGLKKLNINIFRKAEKTHITVEDNGIGRKLAMKKTRGTGKGLKLIKDMITLNRKMGGKEITMSYTDLYDEGGKASGTMVEIVV
jgi:LytS/YehU family sensor histidine kinase